MLADLLRKAHHPAANLIMRDRPALPTAAEPLVPETRENGDLMDEYARLTAQIGLANPHIDSDVKIERFKAFLRAKDWAVFSLGAVVAYMGEKAASESAAQSGWRWRPLRDKDNLRGADFGTPATAFHHQGGQEHRVAASDHYKGPHQAHTRQWDGQSRSTEALTEQPASATPYDKLVPIHALRKVATTEAEFKESVAFFVCDYAPAPHIEYPDPFLMAVIDNPRLKQGVGRFVIDFWDEPGFGIEQQTTT